MDQPLKIVLLFNNTPVYPVLDNRCMVRLGRLGAVFQPPGEYAEWTPQQLRQWLADADAVITSWFSPYLSADYLDESVSPRLRFIGHAAGTVAPHVDPAAWRRGITVVSANAAMSGQVAEWAVLVNTARGLLIDQDALTAECASGRLRAALDVTHPEPLPADHPLWRMDNVILSPHCPAPARPTDSSRLFPRQRRRIHNRTRPGVAADGPVCRGVAVLRISNYNEFRGATNKELALLGIISSASDCVLDVNTGLPVRRRANQMTGAN